MIDIVRALNAWHVAGRAYAIATVVSVNGSAPRRPGAVLAVDFEGAAVGSVSGGCVEGAVYDLCQESITTRTPLLRSFGYSDDAFAIGLMCGGEIEVFVQPVFPGLGEPAAAIAAGFSAVASGEPVALARVIAGPSHLVGASMTVRRYRSGQPKGDALLEAAPWTVVGGTGSAELDGVILHRALKAMETGITEAFTTESGGGGPHRHGGRQREDEIRVFVESSAVPPRMIVFGAIDFAVSLVRAGKFLGYHVTVCDARPVFVTRERFPDADEIVVDWPHRYLATTNVDPRTVLAVLTHDDKFDIPLLVKALRMPVAYVGAMGSRRTAARREALLRSQGLGDDEIARLHAPIGLDLGAQTSEETAVSIAAEIVAALRGGTGSPLRSLSTPIHEPGYPAAVRSGPGTECDGAGDHPVRMGSGHRPRFHASLVEALGPSGGAHGV